MSEIKVNSIKGVGASTAAITVNNSDGTCIANITNNLSNRNLIINGAMNIAQRGTSFTVSDDFTLDRYKFKIAGGGAATITQSSTTPDDFSYSYKVDITTADTSVANTDHGVIMHTVEGYNFAPANFGSSAAKTCTLSFYVRSNKTGTYGVAFQNAAQNRSLIKEYTINSADTWERKSITISPDTGGSWDTTNGTGLKITWGLMGGSTYATSDVGNYKSSNLFLTSNQVNLFDSTSNEWYITGVQVEVGSVATDFEHRSFAQELALCQRYYYKILNASSNSFFGMGNVDGSTQFQIGFTFPVQMRAAPSSIDSSGASNFLMRVRSNSSCTSFSIEKAETNTCFVMFINSGGHGFSDGDCAFIMSNGTNRFIAFNSEL